MSMRRSSTTLIVFTLALIALGGGIYTGSGRSMAPSAGTAKVEKAAIDRLLASHWLGAEGNTVSFATWRGKTVVVNFWASWCPPCRAEMPGFSRLQDKFAANGVQFVGIALDTVENVREFSAQSPVSYPLLMGDAEGSSFARELGNPRLALPYTLIVNASGEVRFARLGAVTEVELDTLLRQLAGS